MSKRSDWRIIVDPNKKTLRSGRNISTKNKMAEQELEDLKAQFEAYKTETERFIAQTNIITQQRETSTILIELQQQMRELKFNPRIEEKEKSMNTTQPLFYG